MEAFVLWALTLNFLTDDRIEVLVLNEEVGIKLYSYEECVELYEYTKETYPDYMIIGECEIEES